MTFQLRFARLGVHQIELEIKREFLLLPGAGGWSRERAIKTSQ
jgi:hypothetical protein